MVASHWTEDEEMGLFFDSQLDAARHVAEALGTLRRA
jgi:hypothetical protein